MSNIDAVDDLALLMNSGKIMAGMEAYLHSYKDGEIINLANEVSDNGQYINYLKEKFRVNDANWVWNIDTANQKIDDLILEYRIIIASNKILPKNISYTQRSGVTAQRVFVSHISMLKTIGKNYPTLWLCFMR